jgi:hypothetical protein
MFLLETAEKRTVKDMLETSEGWAYSFSQQAFVTLLFNFLNS